MMPVLDAAYGMKDYSTSKLTVLHGILNCGMNLGAMIGALTAPFLLKSLGRRKSMIVTDFIAIIGAILIFIKFYAVCVISRIICGFAVGFNSAIVPMYINEIIPSKLKGPFGTLF